MLHVSVLRRRPGFCLEARFAAPTPGIIALFGRSGSGKSTLVNIISGLWAADAGDIRLDDEVLTDTRAALAVPVERRRIGYVFQDARLFPHLNVAANLRYGERRARAAQQVVGFDEVVTLLGLAQFLQRRPRELSGGERQRVALGRALAIDPALLLLDEPLSALDAPLRRALRDELRALLTDLGTAAVLVTHDFTEAYRLGDRIVVYDAGRVVQSAPRSELLWQPASESVARIMGIRNVLRGTVVKATPDRIQFRWRGQLLEAVNSPSRSYLPAADSPIAFFIRPEYVRLIRKDRGPADPSHHMNLMDGVVVGEEDFGTTWSLRIRLTAAGEPAQGDHDLEVEVPHLVYEILEIDRDRRWQFSIHRGSIHVLPA